MSFIGLQDSGVSAGVGGPVDWAWGSADPSLMSIFRAMECDGRKINKLAVISQSRVRRAAPDWCVRIGVTPIFEAWNALDPTLPRRF
jgi:hypothetical protein